MKTVFLKRVTCCMGLCLLVLPAFCQAGNLMTSSYVDFHNISKENTYAQLNKSTYLAGENLWFKIYITDTKTGLLAFETNKVYTDLFAPDGSLHTRKIWQAQDGCAFGQISLPDTLVGGSYTFKVYTNWQQNFEPERMFTTQVQVKGFEEYVNSAPSASARPWDIRFFPEGGDLIAGTTARIAVKGVDQYGNGRKFSGKVMSDQTELLAFETNDLGMGSLVLSQEYSSLEGLQAAISLPDGRTQLVPLPIASNLGVSLYVHAIGKEQIDIFLNTNTHSLQAFANRPFYCMVHQNGIIAELFTINSLNQSLTKLQLPKAYLPAGMNTVTLFDASFKPIAERVFFAEKEEAMGIVSINTLMLRDSIEVRIQLTDRDGNMAPALLSASVLWDKTAAGNFNSNIYAHFLLAAELRGQVENPAYYFKERSLERLQALDNLLLTQAWRKYAWNTILNEQNRPQPLPYAFEYGFAVSGTSMRQTFVGNVATAKSQVVLNMSHEPFTKSAEIASDGSFLFDSLLIFKPYNNLFIMAMDQKGSAGNRFLKNITPLTPPLNNRIPPKASVSTDKNQEEENEEEEWLQFIDPGATLLNSAVVTATRVPTTREVMVNDPYANNQDKYHKITEDDVLYFHTLADLLQVKFGYKIIRDEYGHATGIVNPRNTMTLNMAIGNESFEPPKLIIDGVIMYDWTLIEEIAAVDVEAISEHRGTNVMLGSDGYFGSVHVKTRITPLASRYISPRNFIYIQAEGFEAPIAYYTPSYSNIPDKTHLTYFRCLHWAPDLIAPEGECVFRFPATALPKSVRIRVEGIAGDGMLFSKDAEVAISK